MDTKKTHLDSIDHFRLRALVAEEMIAQRVAADATAAREQVQQALSQTYGLSERDSIDIPTGAITRCAKPLALVPEGPAS